MSAENVNTDLGKTIERGGWMAIGPKLGLLQVDIDLDDVTYSEANDWISVFTFDATSVVLAAGIYVTTQTTSACNAVLGTGGDNTILTATSIGTTGTEIVSTATVPVAFAADGIMTLGFSATPAGGAVRVWALVLDRGDLSGAVN
jgi:hypothetical protein